MRHGQDSFLLPRAPDTDSFAFLCSGAGIALRAIRTKADKLGVFAGAQPRDAAIDVLRWMEQQLQVTVDWLSRGQVGFSPGVMLVYREAIVGLRDSLELAGDLVPDAGALLPWLRPIYPRQAAGESRASGLAAVFTQIEHALVQAQAAQLDALPLALSVINRLVPAAAVRHWASLVAQLAPDTVEMVTAHAAVGMVDDALEQRSGWAPGEVDVAAQALDGLWRRFDLDRHHLAAAATTAIAHELSAGYGRGEVPQ